MKRFHYTGNDREPYLTFTPDHDEALLAYVGEMRTFILPSSIEQLFRHLTEFAAFIDALYLRLLVIRIEPRRVMQELVNRGKKRKAVVSDEPREWWEEALVESEEDEGRAEGEMEYVEEMTVTEDGPLEGLNMAELCNIAWEWHNDVAKRGERLTGRYANCVFMAWGAFCRIFYIAVYSDREKYSLYNEAVLAHHDYNLLVEKRIDMIASGSPVGEFPLSKLFTSARLTIPSLYLYQYEDCMKEYIHMLFLRYAAFISVDTSTGREEEDDALYDDPILVDYRIGMTVENGLNHNNQDVDPIMEEEQQGDPGEEEVEEVEAYDAYKEICLPVGDTPYSIRSEYIYDGELMFRHQLRRLNLSVKLAALYREEEHTLCPIYQSHFKYYHQMLLHCSDAWYKMMEAIVVHPSLRFSVGEQFKTKLSTVQLYHGERERFSRAWKESSNEPGDVLAKFRPSDSVRVASLRQLTLSAMTSTYTATLKQLLNGMQQQYALSREPEEEMDVSRPSPNRHRFTQLECEKEVVLLCKICTEQWFAFTVMHHAEALKERFITEESGEETFDAIDRVLMQCSDTTVYTRKQLPYLIKLMQIYYVIDTNPPYSIYLTHFFIEAYSLWLALASVKHRLIPQDKLHPALRALITQKLGPVLNLDKS